MEIVNIHSWSLQLVTLLMKGNQRLVLLLFLTFRVLRNPSREFWIATTLKLLKNLFRLWGIFSPNLRICHERTTNRRHLFYPLEGLGQRIHWTDQTSVWYTFERDQKPVFFCKKENSALSEHTCLTYHTIRWDNSKIITTNRRYHRRLCLEAWHINSAHAPLHRDDGGLPPGPLCT